MDLLDGNRIIFPSGYDLICKSSWMDQRFVHRCAVGGEGSMRTEVEVLVIDKHLRAQHVGHPESKAPPVL